MAKKKKGGKPWEGAATAAKRSTMIGSKLSFAAAEAYKLLRTNIMFSFPGDAENRVVGITSSFAGEGKSVTSINLAYTLAQAEKTVLLIDADMRLSAMAKTMGLRTKPGLSNLLVGLNSVGSATQIYKTELPEGDTVSFDVIAAGDVPPNPSELLGSPRMRALIERLRERYDYILIDLPPVTEVSDALVASRLADGMIVVVRRDRVTRTVLAETMRQFQLAEARVLGFVFNGADLSSKSYYRSGYYTRE